MSRLRRLSALLGSARSARAHETEKSALAPKAQPEIAAGLKNRRCDVFSYQKGRILPWDEAGL